MKGLSGRNLVEVHRRQAERLEPLPALRFKRYGLYHDVTWGQYRSDALACAAALIDAGIQPGDRVGLWADNCVEWLVADMGILTAAAVNVPPHAPLTAPQVEFQLQDAGVNWLFVGSRTQLDNIRSIQDRLQQMRGMVVFEDFAGDGAVSWAAFLQRGRQSLHRHANELARREATLDQNALATIMYTSGTTGNPKGVMLTHGNLLSNALANLAISDPTPLEILLSWLPYSHIYARTVDHYMSLTAGFTICLAESVDTIVQNLDDVRPTRMTAVPRFYEKVLNYATASDPKETGRRLRAIFGPQIDWLSSGGAPLPRSVAEAYHAAGLLLLQGYGLTESSPVITSNRRDRFKIETVGPAIPGIEVKIAPDGEVLTRGPHVMKGYWNHPEETSKAIVDGWLHTGDLGSLDADGFLTITGRKKDLLVLSNGKKVVPNVVEELLVKDPCIDQAVVFGEGRNFLTALIVPHWPNLRRALIDSGHSLDHEPEEVLARQSNVQAWLQERVNRALDDLSPWEHVKKLVILPRPFTVADEELTVSLKLRRNMIFSKHQAELNALYTE